MKKILILIVVIAIFLHFNPQPQVTEYIEDKKAAFLDYMAELSGTKIRMKASSIIDRMGNEISSFSSAELNKLKEITLTRASVKQYYEQHCKSGQSDPEFHTENLRKVCQHVSQFVNAPK